jgi:hypothetical protein
VVRRGERGLIERGRRGATEQRQRSERESRVQNSRPAPAARMRVVVYMSELNDASVSFLTTLRFVVRSHSKSLIRHYVIRVILEISPT